MDCELCEKNLVDLLYGELDDAVAKQMRAHLDSCDGCRQAFAKLEVGRAFARKLELAAAPSLATVLAAAREQAATNRAAREPGVPASAPADPQRVPEQSGLPRWLLWLGAIAMGPQLGVATVLLLMVGIGLWYLPQIGDTGGRGAIDVIEPEPPPMAETTALAPAEPLELAHDPRTGRVVTREGSSDEGQSDEGRPPPAPPRPQAADHRPETPAEPTPELFAEVERDVPGSDDPGAGLVESDSLPEVSSAAGAYEGGSLPPLAPAPEHAVAPPVTPSPASSPSLGARSVGATPRSEMEDLSAGPRGDELAAAALHGQARQLATAGRCPDAIGRYEQLQARYPAYPEGARASVEMAECMRRLGRVGQARTVLERASRSPVAAVASSARRQLVEMDAEERALTQPAAPAEAATASQ